MKTAKILMIVAGLALLAMFLFPLWNITLEAPQYPIPLSMDIYIHKFMDYHPHDIQNINLMNHYVGMDMIPDSIPEFTIFPIVIIVMGVAAILIGLFGNKKMYWSWFVVMVLLAVAGLVDFYLWEYRYGHNLNPEAIMKFTDADGGRMGFQPPFLGSKQILNFFAHSYPGISAFFLGGSIVVSFIAALVGRKK